MVASTPNGSTSIGWPSRLTKARLHFVSGKGGTGKSTIAASLALALAVMGGLDGLVSGASIVFLLVFGTLNALAVKENVGKRWITLPGAVLAFGALAVLVLHMLGVI